MSERRRQPFGDAPVRRRVAAGLIDTPFILAAIGAGVYILFKRARRAGAVGPAAWEGLREFGERYRVQIWVGSLARAVLMRNWRSPGMRAMRLRRVDASSGEPVSIRSAVIRFSGSALWSAPNRRLARRPQRCAGEQTREPRPPKQPLRQVLGAAAPLLLAALPPRRQSLLERLAGTATVVEPKRGTRRGPADPWSESGSDDLSG